MMELRQELNGQDLDQTSNATSRYKIILLKFCLDPDKNITLKSFENILLFSLKIKDLKNIL